MTITASTLGHMGIATPATTSVAPRTTRTRWPKAINKKTAPTINEKVLWLMARFIHFRQ
jgi:hypothetical protein